MKLPRCVKCGRVIRKNEYMADARTKLLGKHIVCPGVLPDSTGLWKVSRILDALAGYHGEAAQQRPELAISRTRRTR